MANIGPKVIVGMSGGVDSSVAALLLKEQGYEVIGVTMQIWQDERNGAQRNCACSVSRDPRSADDGREDTGCCGLSAVEDARRVAGTLGIPYYVMNFRREFKEHVIDYFVQEYLNGRTPNPCIACNRFVKWEALLDRSLKIGADYIATGHYARVEQLPNGRFAIRNSVTAAKDQTYALYNLTQEQLSRTLMPVGDHTKEEIREIAERIGLPVAQKKDSMEICFIPDHDYAGFIEKTAKRVPPAGNFVDQDGTILGRHRGITHYTVGQRKGLNLSMGRPVFVTEIRPETNEVVIGDERQVFSDSLVCSNVNWMAVDGLHGEEMEAVVKIRYSHKGAPCRLRELPDGRVECRFETPQRAVTPGQAAVFYQEDHVVGGGTIL